VFDCVEIDSTFYKAPSTALVQQWTTTAPEGFLFTPKLPRRITHQQHLQGTESYLGHFLRTIRALDEKLGPILVQLPPSFKYPKHEKALSEFISSASRDYRFAVEFRHKSWFNPEVERLLETRNVCQVWSVNRYLTTPATVTADFVYLRLVGDRTITEFKGIQRDQSEVMESWSAALKQVKGSVRERFVLFNNHFAGFGPASANEFRRLMGLVEMDWTSLMHGSAPQKTLFEFSKQTDSL